MPRILHVKMYLPSSQAGAGAAPGRAPAHVRPRAEEAADPTVPELSDVAVLAAPAPLPSGHPPSAAFPAAQALSDACDAAAPRSTFPAGGVGAGLSASCESN